MSSPPRKARRLASGTGTGTGSGSGTGTGTAGDDSDDIVLVSSKAGVKPRPAPIKHPLLSTYSCPICLCPPTQLAVTPCGHMFCGACIFEALKAQTTRSESATGDCPVCRTPIPGGLDRAKKKSIRGVQIKLGKPTDDPRQDDGSLK